MPRTLKLLPLLLCLFILSACSNRPAAVPPILPAAPTATLPSPTATPRPSSTPSPTATHTPTATLSPTPEPAILTLAGDISICGQDGDDETAALLADLPGAIQTAGDNSNDDGRLVEYTRCFAPTWGRFLDRIHPAPGNHEYDTPGAAPYFEYFGAAAGQPGQGWYSYDYGGWHIVALNSNCNDVACGTNSAQVQWLKEDLANHPAKCTLAVWHHPRWSSGLSGSDGRMSAAYRALYDAGADLLFSGHDHDYERFAPLDPEGNLDPRNGIRQFVVGTGGAYLRFFQNILPESEAHDSSTFGVMKLTLYPDRYQWQFIPVAGQSYTDSGSAECH